jgi:DNA-binding SARP family transcriptional activator/EAL domain-containing protein (putative c-di-GMP-specific phosphodiesterase class I)/CheY-like chemotaxis protein
MATARTGIEIRLLGPVELIRAGEVVPIGSRQQRAILAMLGLNAGRVVGVDRLCDLIWHDEQPASAPATLQSLISRLRAALERPTGSMTGGTREVLRTRDPGWVLGLENAAVDALRFHDLTARARSHRGRGDTAAAVTDLADALALWRGPALADLVDAGFLVAQATTLDESRADAVEDLTEAELATGDAAAALARMEEHIELNPLRERGWGLLMVALYRLGRQAAALAAFQQVRAVLADQVGLEPSPELVDIERRILAQDRSLDLVPWRGAGSSAATREAQPSPPEPAPATATAPAPAPARAGGEFADYTVVVVDDHDFQRRMAVSLLNGLGVGTVLDAADGNAAVRLLEAGPKPDVVICDIDMPGMDGIEFVTHVAEHNLACAAIIASALEPNVVRTVEAIGHSHGLQVLAALEKPLTARRIEEAFRQYMPLRQDGPTELDGTALNRETLRDALAHGELRAEFQPRIDLGSGALTGVQVGGRWLRAGASIGTAPLLSSIVRAGLVLEYVRRLVAESCELLDDLMQSGRQGPCAVRMAVDASLLPTSDPTLADELADAVRGCGHDPRRFVLEFEDVSLARASSAAIATVARLRVKGFGLSLTHVGLSPSWVHQVARVPLSEVKLDSRLVAGAADDVKRYARLEAALVTAREARLPVVAAGCDRREDFDALVALGCNEAQGRFLASPMSHAQFAAWAATGFTLSGAR